MMLRLGLSGLIIVGYILAQSFSTSGSVSWNGSATMQLTGTDVPATNVDKCTAYLADAGVNVNAFKEPSDDYEQIGNGISCFMPALITRPTY